MADASGYGLKGDTAACPGCSAARSYVLRVCGRLDLPG